MFCAPRPFLGGTKVVVARFQVFRSRTRFWRYRGHRVPFSTFALPDTFPTVPWASGLVFVFCAPGLLLGGTEVVGAHFHVLHSLTCFWRYRGHQSSFSCFALPDKILVVTKGVRSCFHVLRSLTRFWLCRGRRVPFSYFALPDSFWAVPRAPGLFFIFCALEQVFGGAEGVSLIFMFCVPGLFLGVIEGVGSHFHVLRSWTHYGRYCGRHVPFSCFAVPTLFGRYRGGTEGVRSYFHILRSPTRFR
jgi:muconolactone delta-isomerase